MVKRLRIASSSGVERLFGIDSASAVTASKPIHPDTFAGLIFGFIAAMQPDRFTAAVLAFFWPDGTDLSFLRQSKILRFLKQSIQLFFQFNNLAAQFKNFCLWRKLFKLGTSFIRLKRFKNSFRHKSQVKMKEKCNPSEHVKESHWQ